MSFSIFRLAIVCSLLPLYIVKVTGTAVPCVLLHSRNLFTKKGRRQLVQSCEEYREREKQQAESQLGGSFVFPTESIIHVRRDADEWMPDLLYASETEEFDLCGAKV
jgi:hypothetical protein